MTPTMWHNPRCSKSRATLALLEEAGHAPILRRYLDDPPSAAELEDVLTKLGLGAAGLLRTGEKVFRELGLTGAEDDATLIKAMTDHPILIERPVVILGPNAIIGRPPEGVLTLFA